MDKSMTQPTPPKGRTQKQHMEMMLSFKVNPCKEKKKKIDDLHINTCFDWHPKAGDRRRNPRQYIYNIQQRCEEFHSTLYNAVAAQHASSSGGDSKSGNKPRAEGQCRNGDMCPHYHHKFEALYHPRFYKTNPCTFYTQKGRCTNRFCAFIHPGEEGDCPVLFETRERVKAAILDSQRKLAEARRDLQGGMSAPLPLPPPPASQPLYQQQAAPSPFVQTKEPPLNPWAKSSSSSPLASGSSGSSSALSTSPPSPTGGGQKSRVPLWRPDLRAGSPQRAQQRQQALLQQQQQQQRAGLPVSAAPFYPSVQPTRASAQPPNFDIFQVGQQPSKGEVDEEDEEGGGIGSASTGQISSGTTGDEGTVGKTPKIIFSESDPVFHPSSRHGKWVEPISPRRVGSSTASALSVPLAGTTGSNINNVIEEPISPSVVRNEREREEALEREMEEWEKIEEEKMKSLEEGRQQQKAKKKVHWGFLGLKGEEPQDTDPFLRYNTDGGISYSYDVVGGGGGGGGGVVGGGGGGHWDNIEEFLRALDLERYIENFRSQEVDMELLRGLSVNELTQVLGLPWGPAKKIVSKLHSPQEELYLTERYQMGPGGGSGAMPAGSGLFRNRSFHEGDRSRAMGGGGGGGFYGSSSSANRYNSGGNPFNPFSAGWPSGEGGEESAVPTSGLLHRTYSSPMLDNPPPGASASSFPFFGES